MSQRLKLTTSLNQSSSGTLYALTKSLICLKITNHRKVSFRLFNLDFVKTIQLGNNVIKVQDVERAELGGLLSEMGSSTASASPDPDSITTRLTRKLSAAYGPTNVTRSGSEIVIFGEVKLSKPYTLGKSGNILVLKETKRLDEIKGRVKEFWLEVGTGRKGG